MEVKDTNAERVCAGQGCLRLVGGAGKEEVEVVKEEEEEEEEEVEEAVAGVDKGACAVCTGAPHSHAAVHCCTHALAQGRWHSPASVVPRILAM